LGAVGKKKIEKENSWNAAGGFLEGKEWGGELNLGSCLWRVGVQQRGKA